MDIIERLAPEEFSSYLSKYKNTICGRHPIGVMLNVSGIGTSTIYSSWKRNGVISKLNQQFLYYPKNITSDLSVTDLRSTPVQFF